MDQRVVNQRRIKMAELNSLAACFPVADISATIRWYEEQLGFVADPFPSAEPYVFAILRRDEVEIMLQRVDGYEKPDLYRSRSVEFGMLT